MSRSEINKIVSIYDHLIKIAKKGLDKKVKMEWGNWFPTMRVLRVLEGRRNRVKNGSLNAEYRLFNYLNRKENKS